MRSQNIKHNSSGKVGGASCLLLTLLTFLAINPIISSSAFAEEIPESGIEETPDEANLPSPQADTPSAVSISFSPTSGSASLSPTTSAGQSAQIKVLATVNVQQSGGYSVYVKSSSQNLVGQKSSANIIPGMQGSSTYTNMPVNTWGYYAAEGSVIPDSATYKAISTTGNGDKIAENTSNKITSDTKTIALSFATKINDEKPADTYQNTVTMSVISSPLVVAEDFGTSDMQEMTPTICANAKDNNGDGLISGQLKDTRDGKYYWVSKLADGKCWMTQNLDLDLSTSKTLTSADTDVTSNWTPGFNTASQANSSTVNSGSQTETRSWSLGNYRMKDSIAASGSDCGYPKNDASQCTSQFEAYTTPTTQNGDVKAHYILGNHYQWNAATAGTGGTITSGTASSSICPKGWRLPTSNTGGEFEKLVTALGGTSSTDNVTKAPFYGVRGGIVYQNTNLFYTAGLNGYYWSSTPLSGGDTAYNLYFGSTASVNPSASGSRQNGFSVRCVAR